MDKGIADSSLVKESSNKQEQNTVSDLLILH